MTNPTKTISQLGNADADTGGDVVVYQNNSSKKATVGNSIYKNAVDSNASTSDRVAGKIPVLVNAASTGVVDTKAGGTGFSVDRSSIGNNKYFGTNSSGVVGSHSLPSGGTPGDNTITTAMIQNGAITSAKLASGLGSTPANNSITTAMLRDDAVTNAKVAANAVQSSQIMTGAVNPLHLDVDGGHGVSNGKVYTVNDNGENANPRYTGRWTDKGSITIGDGSISDAKIADGAVTTPKIANEAVTYAKVHPSDIASKETDILSPSSNSPKLVSNVALDRAIQDIEGRDESSWGSWSSVGETIVATSSNAQTITTTGLDETLEFQSNTHTGTLHNTGIAAGKITFYWRTSGSAPSNQPTTDLPGSGSTIRGWAAFIDGTGRYWIYLVANPEFPDSEGDDTEGWYWDTSASPAGWSRGFLYDSDGLRLSFGGLPNDNRWYVVSAKAHDGPPANEFNDELCIGKRNGSNCYALRIVYNTNSFRVNIFASKRSLDYNVPDGSVTTAKIDADAVTNVKLADDAVDTENIADDAITSALIDAGAVDAAAIASNAVTTAKINADAVTNAKLADDAVDTENIVDDAITSALIDAGAVDATAIASNAVTTVKIDADAVTGEKIADDAVDTENIVDDAITSALIDAGAVDATAIASNAVTTAKINADAVTGAKIADDAIGLDHINAGNQAANRHLAINSSNDGITFVDPPSGGTPANDSIRTKQLNSEVRSQLTHLWQAWSSQFERTIHTTSGDETGDLPDGQSYQLDANGTTNLSLLEPSRGWISAGEITGSVGQPTDGPAGYVADSYIILQTSGSKFLMTIEFVGTNDNRIYQHYERASSSSTWTRLTTSGNDQDFLSAADNNYWYLFNTNSDNGPTTTHPWVYVRRDGTTIYTAFITRKSSTLLALRVHSRRTAYRTSISYTTDTLWSATYSNRLTTGTANLSTGKNFDDYDFVSFQLGVTGFSGAQNYRYYSASFPMNSIGSNNELIEVSNRINIDLQTNTSFSVNNATVGAGITAVYGSKYTIS